MNVKLIKKMKNYFKNKIALVTGSSRGFGYSVALKLAQEGADLIITSRTTGALEELSEKNTKLWWKSYCSSFGLKKSTSYTIIL